MTLDQYLDRTVFYRPRPFTKEQFKQFIFSQSRDNPETIELLEELARSNRYFMATLNNESLELNLYRIERFGLRRFFKAFFTSCFLGMRKPDDGIYRAALQITQRSPDECVFIDDRPLNLECARLCSMQAIHFKNTAQLRQEFQRLGIEVEAQSGARI